MPDDISVVAFMLVWTGFREIDNDTFCIITVCFGVYSIRSCKKIKKLTFAIFFEMPLSYYSQFYALSMVFNHFIRIDSKTQAYIRMQLSTQNLKTDTP